MNLNAAGKPRRRLSGLSEFNSALFRDYRVLYFELSTAWHFSWLEKLAMVTETVPRTSKQQVGGARLLVCGVISTISTDILTYLRLHVNEVQIFYAGLQDWAG